MYFLLIIVLSFQIAFSNSNPALDPGLKPEEHKNGSHNLLKGNNSTERKSRCVPCGDDNFERPGKMPIANNLNPEYRGNGADNLGYDWSPMAWGGLAFPHKPKMFMVGMQGRGGRQMGSDRGQSQGNVHIICDTCRAYWDGNMGFGTSSGGQMGGQGYYQNDGRGGYRPRGRMMRPQDFEARVSSPTVGVLVKPGSRIAYIPSKNGDMYWDGISGGGTRWDGFSNGISWVMNGPPNWDRMDPRNAPGDYVPQRPEKNYPYFPHSDRPWEQKGVSGFDSTGKGYYLASGYPNQPDPQMRDRGYASNWHYGSTDQNGWNGNNMKWNYGAKNWDDSARPANRFYFNSPQDRDFGGGGNYLQYGDKYPVYQRDGSHPSGMGFFHYWFPAQSFRLNDRDPNNFPNDGDRGRPWDYSSANRFGNQGPNFRPNGTPGSSFEGSGNIGNPGKYPLSNRFDKIPGSDKNDKPGVVSFGYGPSPNPGSGYPFGGTQFPDRNGNQRPDRPGDLFYPHSGHQQPSFPGSFGSVRPIYQGGQVPGTHPASENQINNYLNGDRPSFIYGGGRPEIGGGKPSSGYQGFPDGYGSIGARPDIYPTGGDRYLDRYPSGSRPSEPFGGSRPSGGYPSGGGRPDGGYPSGGSRPDSGYPSGGSRPDGVYPGGGSRPDGGYPSGGSRPDGGYPSGGSRPDGGYPGGSSRPDGGYPSGGSRPGGGYPSGGSRPDGGYPSGGSRPDGGYPSGGSRPDGGYPSGGSRPDGGYPSGGSRPDGGYPSGGSRPGGGYPSGGSRPDGGYPSGGSRPDGGYPSGGSRPDGGYPSGGSRPDGGYPSGGSRPDGGYPSGGSRPDGGYPSGGSRPDGGYPSGGSRPHPTYTGGGIRYGGYPGDPGGYPSGGSLSYPLRPGGYPSGGFSYPRGGYTKEPIYSPSDQSNYPDAGYSSGGKNFPKGYYTGFITELNPDRGHAMYGNSDNYYGNNYAGDKNAYPGINKDRYPFGGDQSNRYPSDFKGGYPSPADNRFPYNDNYGSGNKDKYPGGDRFYFYGQDMGRDKYAGGHNNNGNSNSDFDRNSNFGHDKNSWNYGDKDGIYRRSGGSYPPYRGGQYFTSSYLASMSTPSGSTQEGSETKTQTVTKPDEVTPSTSQSS